MHSEINRDQNASTTLEICPHKNCLAHLEFLNDEVSFLDSLDLFSDTDTYVGEKIAS